MFGGVVRLADLVEKLGAILVPCRIPRAADPGCLRVLVLEHRPPAPLNSFQQQLFRVVALAPKRIEAGNDPFGGNRRERNLRRSSAHGDKGFPGIRRNPIRQIIGARRAG